MRPSGDRNNDRRRCASSDGEPPPFGRTSLATTRRQQGQQHPEGHVDPEHPYKHRYVWLGRDRGLRCDWVL